MTLIVWLLVMSTVPTQPLARETRRSVLDYARRALSSNGAVLSTRTPQRAAKHSTFHRFFSGGAGTCGAPAPAPSPSSSPAGVTVNPVDFGADPTGVHDSSNAFESAVAAALLHNTSGHTMGGGIVDLGGCTIDLQGGDYLISRPVCLT